MPISKVETGDLLTVSIWNNMVEAINSKTNRAGDTFSGALTVADTLTVTNKDRKGTLKVDNLTITKTTDVVSNRNPTGTVELLTVDYATGVVKVNDLKVTNPMESLTVGALTVTNKMNSLTVANAVVDNLTVTNPMESLTVKNLTVKKTDGNGTLIVDYLYVGGSRSSNIAKNIKWGDTYISGYSRFMPTSSTDSTVAVRSSSFGHILESSYSIITVYNIAAPEFHAFSDARIKQKLHISNAAEDLAMLMQLKVTDYTMIDTVSNGNRVSKKLIAQEVAEVYPNAVSYTKGFIPNIYQLAQIENGFVTLPNPDLAIGDKVRLIFEDQQMELHVTERHENGFSVCADKPESQLPNGSVFVFGKEVDDFHSIDYDAITMLNTSATQAVVKQLNGLETKHAALKARFEALETSLKSFPS
jgi:hypothetical protein